MKQIITLITQFVKRPRRLDLNQALTLNQALDHSLAHGYHTVNWTEVR